MGKRGRGAKGKGALAQFEFFKLINLNLFIFWKFYHFVQILDLEKKSFRFF
jgi:hypothetical protein